MLDSPLRQKDNQRYNRRNQSYRRVGAAEREAAEIVQASGGLDREGEVGGEGLFEHEGERVDRDCGNRHRRQRSSVGLPNLAPSNYFTLL
jgi:hypothetical protein